MSRIMPPGHKGPDLGGFSKAAPASYFGEIIAIKYHTYNAIETLAPLVNQDDNLSVTLNSQNLKIFENPNQTQQTKTILCFLETSVTQSKDPKPKPVEVRNNVSFLVNQTDQIPNLLSCYHAKGKLQGNILDFTIRKFRFLYLLYAKSVTILDFKDLLSSDADISIVQSIQLSVSPNQLNEFTCMEVTDTPDQSLLLFTDIASRKTGEKAVAPAGILHIDCSEFAGKQSQTAHKQTLL